MTSSWMNQPWWVLWASLGVACSTQPSLPDGFSGGGGGAGGGGAGGGTSGQTSSGPCEAGPGLTSECLDWASCDPCAIACACDQACLVGCERRLFLTNPVDDVLKRPHDPVRGCGDSFLHCFAEPFAGIDGAGNCHALDACCAHLQSSGSDAAGYCQALADDGDEAACLLARYRYLSNGDCELCGDPQVVEPNCENWVLCDDCATRCEPCDQACIANCKARLFQPLANAEEVARCDPSILECFTPDQPTGHCAALEPCCEIFKDSDDGILCRGYLERGNEGACFLLHRLYNQNGVCD